MKRTTVGLIVFMVMCFRVSPWADSYSIQQASDPSQYRFYCNGKHFMSLIYEGGICDFRPHPLVDNPDAWGSSWYFQPFLPGAVLKDAVTTVTADSNGISFRASGKVSATTETYGNWWSDMLFVYKSADKKIEGSGSYYIKISGTLSGHGDLNLYKAASNRLDNVPLVGDGYGDTGDIKRVDITYRNGAKTSWQPIDIPGFFPQDLTSLLIVDLVGEYNNVDTKRQGYSFSIKPAQKPCMKIGLNSRVTDPGNPILAKIMFGALYDTSKSQDFSADNVGVTPLIPQASSLTNFSFDVLFESIPEEKILRSVYWDLY